MRQSSLRTPSLLALAGALVLTTGADAAFGVELMPHRAVYDLSLDDSDSANFDAVEGRIVVEMTRESCEALALEYRFVARYLGNQEMIVVDQRIELEEPVDGTRLRFSNVSTVDGMNDQSSIGTAVTEEGQTTVTYAEPEDKDVEIPAASFPIAHTRNLIEAAAAGEFIHETAIFDGDMEAESETRSTSFISDVEADPSGSSAEHEGEDAADAGEAQTETSATEDDRPGADVLSELARWRISESYYDRTGSADGEPDFSTSYTLYENGVSDDLLMNFDGYSLTGSMREFTPLTAPDCSDGPVEN